MGYCLLNHDHKQKHNACYPLHNVGKKKRKKDTTKRALSTEVCNISTSHQRASVKKKAKVKLTDIVYVVQPLGEHVANFLIKSNSDILWLLQ